MKEEEVKLELEQSLAGLGIDTIRMSVEQEFPSQDYVVKVIGRLTPVEEVELETCCSLVCKRLKVRTRVETGHLPI